MAFPSTLPFPSRECTGRTFLQLILMGSRVKNPNYFSVDLSEIKADVCLPVIDNRSD